jgi:DNA-damage-inducible protein D
MKGSGFMDEQELTSELIIFLEGQQEEHYTIRKVWYDGRLYFSIVDIITAMQVSQRAPRQYWAQLKERVKDEGFEEAASRIMQFRLKASDGRLRNADCADQETLLRLIQSIPSKRAEPIKQWLAKTGSQKLDEMALQRRPEAAFEQMVHQYIERGYEPDWAWTRAQGDLIRNELTDEWEDRGAKGPREFGILTGIMHKGAFDLLPSDHKLYKNIPQKENLRDHMTIAEQGVSIFTETIGISLHRKRDTQGFQGLQRDAHDAGRAGKQAREIAEATLGERVVSRENYLHLKKVKGKQQREQKRLKQGPQGSLFDEPETGKE